MLTTAGVICLRSGASEDLPLACSSIGTGTLALAHTAAVTARPNAATPSSSLIAVIFHRGPAQVFLVLLGGQKGGPAPGAGLSVLATSIITAPVPSPGSAQSGR